MIYHSNSQISESDFLKFLELSRKSILNRLKYSTKDTSTMSGNEFELLVFHEMCAVADSIDFQGELIHTTDREFPDIIAAGYYGIEVKATKKDNWTSIGNSVLESSRLSSVEKIYILFGKLGGIPDVMCREYEECMRGIAVTHYPRYQIDMKLESGQSIFDHMGVSYDSMRSEKNPVRHVRDFYRSQMSEGDALWWIDDGGDSIPELSPVIRNYSSLDSITKDSIKAELFVLHPEILSNSSNKYRNVPAYLASRYGVVCANVRDIFTAGGRVALQDVDGNDFMAPQIIGELLRLAPIIEKKIAQKTIVELSNSWGHHVNEDSSKRSSWLYEANKHLLNSGISVNIAEIYLRSIG